MLGKRMLLFILLLSGFLAGSLVPASAAAVIYGERSTPDYWLARTPQAEEVLLTSQQIADQNADMLLRDESLKDLAAYPESLNGREVRQHIMAAMQDFWQEALPVEYVGQELLSESSWRAARSNCNLNALEDNIEVRYAVTVARANLRLLPVSEAWSAKPGAGSFDALQGAALDPAEAVIIEHDSADGQFAFVQAEDYKGWVLWSDLALADREDWLRYARPQQVAVVTDYRKGFAAGGRNQLYQMGAAIPLGQVEGLAGLFTSAPLGLLLPVREADGSLSIENHAPSYDESLHEGYLPCTRAGFIRQAFKFLGQPYGRGGLRDSVDSASFVQDVYHAMGLKVPRKAEQQEIALLKQIKLGGLTAEARSTTLKNTAEPGDMLFEPGHVMMYLGMDAEGTPIIIHAASQADSVVVSDLCCPGSDGQSMLDNLTSVAGIWH